MWKQRNRYFKWKVTVINSIPASILVYLCTALDTPENIIQVIEKIFYEILWIRKTHSEARNTMIKQIKSGPSVDGHNQKNHAI